MSLNEELDLAIQNDAQPKQNSVDISTMNIFKKECILFETSGQKTSSLVKLFDSIMTVKVTSTDAERTFSVSGGFCTNIRSRLSDLSLSLLVFLKYHFLSNVVDKN